MSAPQYVPSSRRRSSYVSPPRREGGFTADRPGEIVPGSYVEGSRLGTQGPDQGFIYALLPHFADRLQLAPGEHQADVESGSIAVALKRASIFGRAPVIYDLTAAFTVFGFLDASAPADLRRLRKPLFAEVASPHHYMQRRAIPDMVPEEVLRKLHTEIESQYRSDWTSNLILDT